METNKTEEYLNEIRALGGLQNAILTGISVSKRDMTAEFSLITDKTYAPAEEEAARRIAGKYLPAAFSPRVKITKRVPRRGNIEKADIRIYEFAFSRGRRPF